MQAQGASPAAPANVRAANGAEPGQAVVRWDAVVDAAYYRIGWVNMETFRAVEAEDGREWLDVFAFHDVVNRGQTAQTLSDLEPGVQYAFIMASVGHRFGNAAGWSNWTYLTTTAAEVVSCPADAGAPPTAPGDSGTPTPTPEPGATPEATATPAPTPTPVGRDYDTDDDGLIEISSLAQLDVIRHDLDGDGVSAHSGHAAAFPDAMAEMGCLEGCSGYELDANLDFDTDGSGGPGAGDAHWNDGAGWLPVGDPETRFRYNAVFEGNGHTIANLFIRWAEADHIGLFRATGEDAAIRNVRLTGVRVSGKNQVGGLVGSNGGSISGSSVAGRVSGVGQIGGLAGYNSGSVSGSSASVTVSGSGNSVGGLVGRNPGTIADSHATGAVTGEGDYVGGLVGAIGYRNYNSSGSISRSYATGNVTGEGRYVGGLVGYSSGGIAGSYATGNVTGEGESVGGLVGYNHGVITGNYATGSVTGEGRYVGGLVGSNWGPITASYARGSVTGNESVGGLVGSSAYYYSAITSSYATGSVTGNGNVGGLIGNRDYVRVADSYWDTQTTGQSRSGGGAGKTTRELQAPTGSTGIYAEWNAEWWDFGTARQYPVLKYQGMDVAAQRR